MRTIFTLFKTSSFNRVLVLWFDQLTETFESPEKRQFRILKKFISE